MLTQISIGVLAVMVIILAIMVYRTKVVASKVHDHIFNKAKPTDYIQVIDQNHSRYIAEVTQDLNHSHGIAITVHDMETSALFHYTTFAMINDMPVEKCSAAIVSVLDELIAEKENAEA